MIIFPEWVARMDAAGLQISSGGLNCMSCWRYHCLLTDGGLMGPQTSMSLCTLTTKASRRETVRWCFWDILTSKENSPQTEDSWGPFWGVEMLISLFASVQSLIWNEPRANSWLQGEFSNLVKLSLKFQSTFFCFLITWYIENTSKVAMLYNFRVQLGTICL